MRLLRTDHYYCRLAHSHVDALLAEDAHVSPGYGLVSHFKRLLPRFGIFLRTHASIAWVPPTRIVDPPGLDAGNSCKHVQKARYHGLSPPAPFRILGDECDDCFNKVLWRNGPFPFRTSIARLIATPHADESSQSVGCPGLFRHP